MESSAHSEPRDDPVTTVGSRRAVEKMDGEHRADYLINRLEEMFAKLGKRSVQTDAWEGEDEEAEERGEEKRRCKPKKPAKEKSSPTICETDKVGGLVDAEKNLEILQQKEKNRFTFRNGFKTTTVAKDRKLKSEEEIQKIMNLALQRHDKIKRRRKRGTKNTEKLEKRKENILSVSGERTEFDEASAIQRLDSLNSTFNAEALELKTANYEKLKQKKEQMEAVHAELKAKHLSKKSVDLDGVRKYVSEIIQKAREKLLNEVTALQAKTKVDIEEIKIYVEEIVEKARESVLQEAASLKPLQVPQDSESLKKDGIDEIDMNDRRRALKAVHQQLLSSFNSEKRKLMMDKYEKKTEQMMAVHAELKKMVFVRGFGLEDDEDDCFVPRKLFLFEIEGFQKVPQNMETPLGDVDPPNTSTSEESMNHSVDCVTPSKEKKPSMGRRFLRFLGFR